MRAHIVMAQCFFTLSQPAPRPLLAISHCPPHAHATLYRPQPVSCAASTRTCPASTSQCWMAWMWESVRVGHITTCLPPWTWTTWSPWRRLGRRVLPVCLCACCVCVCCDATRHPGDGVPVSVCTRNVYVESIIQVGPLHTAPGMCMFSECHPSFTGPLPAGPCRCCPPVAVEDIHCKCAVGWNIKVPS